MKIQLSFTIKYFQIKLSMLNLNLNQLRIYLGNICSYLVSVCEHKSTITRAIAHLNVGIFSQNIALLPISKL